MLSLRDSWGRDRGGHGLYPGTAHRVERRIISSLMYQQPQPPDALTLRDCRMAKHAHGLSAIPSFQRGHDHSPHARRRRMPTAMSSAVISLLAQSFGFFVVAFCLRRRGASAGKITKSILRSSILPSNFLTLIFKASSVPRTVSCRDASRRRCFSRHDAASSAQQTVPLSSLHRIRTRR